MLIVTFFDKLMGVLQKAIRPFSMFETRFRNPVYHHAPTCNGLRCGGIRSPVCRLCTI